MFIEEYGFVIGIMIEKKSDAITMDTEETFYLHPESFSSRQMRQKNALVTLYHNGNTLSDIGMIWMESSSKEDPLLRFDAYKIICIGKDREVYERSMKPNEDVTKALLEWTIETSRKYEKPLLANALENFLCMLKTMDAGYDLEPVLS